MGIKNLITFQVVEDTSFFDTNVRIEIYSFWGATYGELPVKALRVVSQTMLKTCVIMVCIKVLGVKHILFETFKLKHIMKNTYKEDFGTIYLSQNIKDNELNCHKAIKNFMETQGYNTKYCDVCSIEPKWFDEEVDIRFKFVHYSIPTMANEPYYHIRFKEA